MTVLLALASVVAGAVLLTVLALGLLLIVTPLQSVRGYLEQIAMGVRAIETHAKSIPPTLEELADRLRAVGEGLSRAAERVDGTAGAAGAGGAPGAGTAEAGSGPGRRG